MLTVIIEGTESLNETTNEFIYGPRVVLQLEHSLLSVSKWESKYQKPFLTKGDRTRDEMFGYLKAMVVTPNADLDALDRLSQNNLETIQAYIESTQSATTFGSMPEHRGPGEVITSELIYYWMVAFQIPWAAEKWHLNRLFSLIRICNLKNAKPQKLSRTELARRNKELNDKRRAELGTKG